MNSFSPMLSSSPKTNQTPNTRSEALTCSDFLICSSRGRLSLCSSHYPVFMIFTAVSLMTATAALHQNIHRIVCSFFSSPT